MARPGTLTPKGNVFATKRPQKSVVLLTDAQIGLPSSHYPAPKAEYLYFTVMLPYGSLTSETLQMLFDNFRSSVILGN
jgi:hypothetical protein